MCPYEVQGPEDLFQCLHFLFYFKCVKVQKDSCHAHLLAGCLPFDVFTPEDSISEICIL